jgi:uncharacterized membrane protein
MAKEVRKVAKSIGGEYAYSHLEYTFKAFFMYWLDKILLCVLVQISTYSRVTLRI